MDAVPRRTEKREERGLQVLLGAGAPGRSPEAWAVDAPACAAADACVPRTDPDGSMPASRAGASKLALLLRGAARSRGWPAPRVAVEAAAAAAAAAVWIALAPVPPPRALHWLVKEELRELTAEPPPVLVEGRPVLAFAAPDGCAAGASLTRLPKATRGAVEPVASEPCALLEWESPEPAVEESPGRHGQAHVITSSTTECGMQRCDGRHAFHAGNPAPNPAPPNVGNRRLAVAAVGLAGGDAMGSRDDLGDDDGDNRPAAWPPGAHAEEELPRARATWLSPMSGQRKKCHYDPTCQGY
jgi:hypothetical protein